MGTSLSLTPLPYRSSSTMSKSRLEFWIANRFLLIANNLKDVRIVYNVKAKKLVDFLICLRPQSPV